MEITWELEELQTVASKLIISAQSYLHLFSLGHLENVDFHNRLGSNTYSVRNIFLRVRDANLVPDMNSKVLHLYQISKLFHIKRNTS